MAITKIIKVKANANAAINYVRNPDKTNERLLVSYDGCSESNIELCFKMALANKTVNQNNNCVLAYHFIQSFAPTDEVTPEQAHELGMKFMEQTFGGKYSFVCATHVDKGHIHNHFVMCSAERGMTGKKLDDNLSLLHTIQKNNDRLCREYGLSVIEKKRGKGKNYREWFEDKMNPSGSKKTQLRKLMDRIIMESLSFEDFLQRMKAENVIIEQGKSKKYGVVTKYRFPDEERFHRGYSLGSFYTDDNIKKRITRRLSYLESQKKKAEARKEKKKAAYDAMTPGAKKLDKSRLKISSIQDVSGDISHDNIGLQKWKNVQNARRMQQIQKELHDRYGIRYTEISGHIKSLRANTNYLDATIDKNQKEIAELRQFINDCVMYKKLKIYSTNEEKAEDKEAYYQKHDQKLNAFQDAKFALESRNVDLSAVTSSNIKVLQKRLEQAEQEQQNLREQQLQNEREAKELQSYQKEIDTYLGKKHEDI